jgi:hypothetical protein
MLQAIRSEKRVSITEGETLVELRRVIRRDLWDDNSRLRLTLRRFVAPFEPTIAAALEAANQQFRSKRYEDAWGPHIKLYEDYPEADRNYVLIDPLLLKEVLKNIFTNVRYNFRKFRQPKKGFSHLLELNVSIEEDGAPGDDSSGDGSPMVVLRVVSKGSPFDPEESAPKDQSTFDQHCRSVGKYGGTLQIGPYSGRKWNGTEVELRLISRNDYRL